MLKRKKIHFSSLVLIVLVVQTCVGGAAHIAGVAPVGGAAYIVGGAAPIIGANSVVGGAPPIVGANCVDGANCADGTTVLVGWINML